MSSESKSESENCSTNDKVESGAAIVAYPLWQQVPSDPDHELMADEILERFLDYVSTLKIDLYPAQEEAILELVAGNNLILATPTGSGKSLVAMAMIYRALVLKRRAFYTCPIKALVNEKFLHLCYELGPDRVGLMTGDATVNVQAPVICCTAEILANIALRQGEYARVDDVIMDEFHYYGDRDRGAAWQIPLITLPQARFLLMSATLGDASFFVESLSLFTGAPTKTVTSMVRPVPLEFLYGEYPLDQMITSLVEAKKSPIYMVHFTQNDCAQYAQNLMSVNYCSKEEKQAIAEQLRGEPFATPYGKELSRFLRHGIGIHHAGLLPRYRLLVEKLAQKGLLKVICGTDTLGVGINIPIRTVLFTKLCKFNGEKTVLLTAREFHQISGRAGRKGHDDHGTVVVMAPAHVIENRVAQEKAQLSGKKKIVKSNPPERGYVHWDRTIFEKLLAAPPEPLRSRFEVTQAMLLNVLARPQQQQNNCLAMRELIRRCHDSAILKSRHRARAVQLFRALRDRKILEIIRPPASSGMRPYLQLNLKLQDEFSLNQAQALYLIDAISEFDPYEPDYALKVLTLTEAILEDPYHILIKQTDRAKRDLLMQLKAEGVEYEERMARLEQVEYPKPMREFIEATFAIFAQLHPWVGRESIHPKSIAREMYETFQSFNEYIREYGLERSEGQLLRYLMDVYRALTQTIPTFSKNEALEEITLYFETIIRQADTSLIDEWEKIKDPRRYLARLDDKERALAEEQARLGILFDLNQFATRCRTCLFQVVRALALQQFERVQEFIINPEQWPLARLEDWWERYHQEHEEIILTPDARNKQLVTIQRASEAWEIEQILLDPDQSGQWRIVVRIDLEHARLAGHPQLELLDLVCL